MLRNAILTSKVKWVRFHSSTRHRTEESMAGWWRLRHCKSRCHLKPYCLPQTTGFHDYITGRALINGSIEFHGAKVLLTTSCSKIHTRLTTEHIFSRLFYDALGIWEYIAMKGRITPELKRIWKGLVTHFVLMRWPTCHSFARNTFQWQMLRADNEDAVI